MRVFWWGTLLAREIGLGPLLVRLGLVAGCLIALVVLVAQSRHLLTAKAPVNSIPAEATASDKHTKSPADNAASDMRTRFDAGFAMQPANNVDYVEAAKLM